MKKILTLLALATISGATAQTKPVGFLTYTFPATPSSAAYLYISTPLSTAAVFTGKPTAVGAATLTVGVASWTAGQFARAAAPCYVTFTSGAQAGRTLAIVSNTGTQLTLETSDASAQTTSLLESGFAVTTSDTFEISTGYTLGSFFGSPPVIGSGPSAATADQVGLWNRLTSSFDLYYYRSDLARWVKNGLTTDAGNTALPPRASLAIVRQAGRTAAQMILSGRVATVAPLLKQPGGTVYAGSLLPVDITLSQLVLGTNWTKGSSVFTADTLSIFNSALGKWEAYYQTAAGQWLKSGTDASQNATTLPAGSAVAFLKRSATISGSTSFLSIALPYTP